MDDEPEHEVRVLVADDHPLQRASVRRVLEAEGFVVVAEASNARGAVDAARENRPDVCLLDIDMPGSGITAAEAITRELPETTVVMLTVSGEDEDLFAAIRAGAAGYLLKDMDPARLAHSLRGALAGETAMPRTLMRRVVEQASGRGRRRLQLRRHRKVELSHREWEILDALKAGRTTADIARQLHVSPVTVRVHISSILRKLRVTTRDEALGMLDDE